MRNVPVNAGGGAVTGTLPACNAATKGLVYAMKKIDSSSNPVTYAVTGNDTIDGKSTAAIAAQYATVSVQCSDTAGRWDMGF